MELLEHNFLPQTSIADQLTEIYSREIPTETVQKNAITY